MITLRKKEPPSNQPAPIRTYQNKEFSITIVWNVTLFFILFERMVSMADSHFEGANNTCSSNTIEQMRLEQARMIDWICIFLIFISIVASAVSFCITKSIVSFSFISLLSLLPSMRRRKEEAIFPISSEDLQIKLKELDVECERIKCQNKSPNLPFLTWLKHFIRK